MNDEKDGEKLDDGESPQEGTLPETVDGELLHISSPDKLHDYISGIINRIISENKTPVEKEKTLEQSFVLPKEELKDLQAIAKRRLELVEKPESATIGFSATVGYEGLSREKFETFDNMLTHAGNREEPPRS